MNYSHWLSRVATEAKRLFVLSVVFLVVSLIYATLYVSGLGYWVTTIAFLAASIIVASYIDRRFFHHPTQTPIEIWGISAITEVIDKIPGFNPVVHAAPVFVEAFGTPEWSICASYQDDKSLSAAEPYGLYL